MEFDWLTVEPIMKQQGDGLMILSAQSLDDPRFFQFEHQSRKSPDIKFKSLGAIKDMHDVKLALKMAKQELCVVRFCGTSASEVRRTITGNLGEEYSLDNVTIVQFMPDGVIPSTITTDGVGINTLSHFDQQGLINAYFEQEKDKDIFAEHAWLAIGIISEALDLIGIPVSINNVLFFAKNRQMLHDLTQRTVYGCSNNPMHEVAMDMSSSEFAYLANKKASEVEQALL